MTDLRPLPGLFIQSPKKSQSDWSLIVELAIELVQVRFHQPDIYGPLLSTPAGRVLRPERREACVLVMKVLLGHLDLATFRVGVCLGGRGFIDLDMEAIVRESGLNRRRCERAIGHLRRIGFVDVHSPTYHRQGVPFAGLRAVRSVTWRFFEWAGLASIIKRERRLEQSVIGREGGGG